MSSTIKLSKETKELIGSFGDKSDTYEDIVKRMYTLAVREQTREFLFSTEAIPIQEAINRAEKRWQK